MKYWSRVKVTSWFYEWMEGTVVNEITEWGKATWMYQVKFWIIDTVFDIPILPESSLELIK